MSPSGRFTQLSAGGQHGCGLRTNGTVVCWGDNSAGQSSAPTGTFSEISAGYLHTCGVRTNGVIECWGDNQNGQATP